MTAEAKKELASPVRSIPRVCPHWKHVWENCPTEMVLRDNHEKDVFVRLNKWFAAAPDSDPNKKTPCSCGRDDAWKCYWRFQRTFVLGQGRAVPTEDALGLTPEERERLRRAKVRVRYVAYPGNPTIDRAIQQAVLRFGVAFYPDPDYLESEVGDTSRDKGDRPLSLFDGSEEDADVVFDTTSVTDASVIRQALPPGYFGLSPKDPLRHPITRYYVPNMDFRYVCASVAEEVLRMERKIKQDLNPLAYLQHFLHAFVKIAVNDMNSPVSSPEYKVRRGGFPHAKVDYAGNYENDEQLWGQVFSADVEHEGIHRQSFVLNDWDAFNTAAQHNDDETDHGNWAAFVDDNPTSEMDHD